MVHAGCVTRSVLQRSPMDFVPQRHCDEPRWIKYTLRGKKLSYAFSWQLAPFSSTVTSKLVAGNQF